MKKCISVLLSAALCLMTINFTTFAEEQKTGTVYMEQITGAVGETVNVPIGIKDNQGIISLAVELSYDTTALKLVSVTQNDSFWKSAKMTPAGDLNAQPYKIMWYDGLAKTDFAEDGILADVSFEILKEGSHEIALSIYEGDTLNAGFEQVAFDVSNGAAGTSSGAATSEPATETKPAETTAVTETTTAAAETTLATTEVPETTTVATVPVDGSENLCLSELKGSVGETVVMPISLRNNPGIISLMVDIYYDAAALKLVKVDENPDFWSDSKMTPGGDLLAQPYRMIWSDGLAKTDFTEDGVLASLSFEILKEGTHQIKLSLPEGGALNSKFESVTLTAGNGTIGTSVATTIQSETTAVTETTTTATTTTATTTTATTTTETTTTEPTTTPTEAGFGLGDVNGDGTVDAMDASEILLYAAALGAGETYDTSGMIVTNADIDGNGTIDAVDASNVLIYAAIAGAEGSADWSMVLTG